jgi:hypothetical protein
MSQTFRVQYDDRADMIIDIISELLADHGLEIVCDNLEHDGFDIYTIQRIESLRKDSDDLFEGL